jgi:precorrin-4/cobalt-precorrin-4 C11-methyltransferase
MAIYLSAGRAKEVSAALAKVYGPKSPVALCYRVGWPEEKIVWGAADNLEETLTREKLDRHALMLVGPAVANLKSGESQPKSKLYDANFSHSRRDGES